MVYILQSRVQHVRKSRQEVSVGTWRQKLKQRPQRGDTYWLAPRAHIQLPFLHPQDYLARGGATLSEPLISTIHQEISSRTYI